MDIINSLTESLTSKFGDIVPGILGAIVVLIIGFIIASIVRRITRNVLNGTGIDQRMGSSPKSGFRFDRFISKLLYYIIILYTLVIVLNMLGVDSALAPLQNMINKFVDYIPNVVVAGVIGFAGYMVGKIGSEATGFVSERLESFGSSMGLRQDTVNITGLVKKMVFVLIFVPILIAAIDALNIKVISDPAKSMLGQFFDAIPNILGAVILLGVFFFVGKYVVSILVDLLRNIGLDDMSKKIGLSNVIGDASVSQLVGKIAMFFIVFMGLIAAADKLGLVEIQRILGEILDISGKVFFGLVILMGGIFISNMAASALAKSKDGDWLIPIARFAIMGIFLAFALHTMGIAASIVNLAFGLTLGAIAVAFALSFGLGGREAAGKQMEYFFDKIRKG